MKGSTMNDRRTDQLQALTFLGLLADDVSLATIHFPASSDREVRALSQLVSWVDPDQGAERRSSTIRRRKSISDPTTILYQAAAMVLPSQTADSDGVSLEFLREPLKKLLDKTADKSEVEVVRDFAEILSRVTLMMAEDLAYEKGSIDWTPPASTFSIAR
jgi:hypothetical protein